MSEIRKILDNMGLREFWDYQLRNGEIRFCDPECLAFFKISAGNVLS